MSVRKIETVRKTTTMSLALLTSMLVALACDAGPTAPIASPATVMMAKGGIPGSENGNGNGNGKFSTPDSTTTPSDSTVEEPDGGSTPPDDGSTPPEGGSTTPDDTSGGTVHAADDFESGTKAYTSSGGFSWSSGGATVSSDIAHSGQHSLRFGFNGMWGVNDPNWTWQEQRFTIGGEHREVWFEYYIYFPSGKDGLSSAAYYHRDGPKTDNNKFLQVWGDMGGNESDYHVKTLLEVNVNSTPGDSRLTPKYGTDASRGGKVVSSYEFGGQQYPLVNRATDLGRWIRVRIQMRVGDVGAANGVLRVWKDNTLVVNATNLDNDPADGNQAHGYTHGYLLGWPNSGYNALTHIYIDDFKIFRSNPGW